MYSDNYNGVSRQGPLVLTDEISDPQNANFGIVQLVAFASIAAGSNVANILLPKTANVTQVDVINSSSTSLGNNITITAQKLQQNGSALSPAPAALLSGATVTGSTGIGNSAVSFLAQQFTNQDSQQSIPCLLRATLSANVPTNATALVRVYYYMNML